MSGPMRHALISALAALGIALGAILLHGCGAALDDPDFQTTAAKLAKCRAEGRDAGSYETYDACKKREGLGAHD